jgi:hypothetical protein
MNLRRLARRKQPEPPATAVTLPVLTQPMTNGAAVGQLLALAVLFIDGQRQKRREAEQRRLRRLNRAARKYQYLWMAAAALVPFIVFALEFLR